jgi:ribonuclease BN (tRNA processing enzyme)
VRLTVVGCSGSFPGPESAASCYLVEHDGHRIVLDVGSGSFGPLQRLVDPADVDAVVLSHLHPDHYLDLTGWFVARRHYPSRPTRQLPVLGPPGTPERLARAHDIPIDPGMHGEFDFRDHVDITEIGPFRIRTTRVVHPIPAFAIRVEAGGVALAFSGDTAPTQALVELAAGADLALFEATWLDGEDNPAGLHLTAGEAGSHAAAAGVDRLVLTHLVPGNDPQRSFDAAHLAFDGGLTLAQPGVSYELDGAS